MKQSGHFTSHQSAALLSATRMLSGPLPLTEGAGADEVNNARRQVWEVVTKLMKNSGLMELTDYWFTHHPARDESTSAQAHGSEFWAYFRFRSNAEPDDQKILGLRLERYHPNGHDVRSLFSSQTLFYKWEISRVAFSAYGPIDQSYQVSYRP